MASTVSTLLLLFLIPPNRFPLANPERLRIGRDLYLQILLVSTIMNQRDFKKHIIMSNDDVMIVNVISYIFSGGFKN